MRRLTIGAVACSVWLAGTAATAAEWQIEPRLSTGVAYYNLDVTGAFVVRGDRVEGVEFSDLLYLFGGGATISRGRFFVDLAGQYAFGGNDNLDVPVESANPAVDSLIQEVDFDRVETLFSVGYRLTNELAAFGGFRYANVTFNGDGTLGPIPADFDTRFQQYGPFIGAGYAFPVPSLNSSLVLNGAVAYLRGRLNNELDPLVPASNIKFTTEGDAVGLNGGASWVAKLSNQINLVVGADVSRYDFNDDADLTDFNETVARLRAEVRYRFGG